MPVATCDSALMASTRWASWGYMALVKFARSVSLSLLFRLVLTTASFLNLGHLLLSEKAQGFRFDSVPARSFTGCVTLGKLLNFSFINMYVAVLL